jgi:hypothetical protein
VSMCAVVSAPCSACRRKAPSRNGPSGIACSAAGPPRLPGGRRCHDGCGRVATAGAAKHVGRVQSDAISPTTRARTRNAPPGR